MFCNRIRTESNLDLVAEVLKRERPDLAALQEADGSSFWSGNFNHVKYLVRRAGYPHFVHGEHVKGTRLRYGTALISLHPLQAPVSITFKPSPPTFSKGFVMTTAALPGDPALEIDVVSLHLDFSRSSIRRRQVVEIVDSLHQRKRPLIVMGDFNCTWKARRSALQHLAEDLALRVHEPLAAGPATYWLPRRRLDWILVSRHFRYITYRVLPEPLSDHRAVVSELALR